MTNRPYEKDHAVDAGVLTLAIVGVGLPQYPNDGARFYGVSCIDNDAHHVTVHCFDDLTEGEGGIIDTVVGAQ